ncbi:uncharacterized protein si:dkey-225f5.4 [Poeciliopsis prolifica]|uniref:uncharacterized protein si:dkey-225f5.4 n=1 Tax=Poeciliopsis prolifica TaxID=188132 RepID=UPI002412F905|nr:uncharacterized protein si:dkey-225f5.4 [Poeciliopsis prolifica]
MAEVRRVLERCDPVLLQPCGEPEPDCAEAAGTVLFLTESRRVQKVLWRQLFVLDSMMFLLKGLESAQQLMTLPCPQPPEGGARSRWKALKAETRSGMEKAESLLRSLQDRVQQVQHRRERVTALLQLLHIKRQHQDQLIVSLLKAQHALQSCDRQLERLRAQSEAALRQLMSWRGLRDLLQVYATATQEVMQIQLISVDQSELLLEIRPHLSSQLSANELQPPRLAVHWCHDNRFTLQVGEELAGQVEGCGSGRRNVLSATLLDVLQSYTGLASLLAEIHSLRASFAIDWCPAQRLLVYLKSAALVCHLQVEDGYPAAGSAQLSSVLRDGRPVDTQRLKPRKAEPSLTDWLVFLCNSPLV